jgi:predicted transcriptional regulator
MQRKGLVASRKSGTANVYSATVHRQDVAGPVLRRLVRHVFGGHPKAVLECLLDEGDVDSAELAELRRLINQQSGAPKNSAKKPSATRSRTVDDEEKT